jgi:mannose-1-phosphate guanylyltransferase
MLYANLESISIDYGILERSRNVLMVPATFQWSDLGSWNALDDIVERGDAGNILRGNTSILSQNQLSLRVEDLLLPLGLKTWWSWTRLMRL